MEGPIHECERLKDEGNMHLKANTFEQAIQSYTQAIEIAGRGKEVPEAKIAVYLANRAFAHIKMESYGLAIADAQASIAHNPSYYKAYIRLAFAHEILQHYKYAFAAYLKAFEISGNSDENIHQKLTNCKRESEECVRRRKLEMLHDDKYRGPKKDPAYKDWREIVVENDYTGPRLDEQGIVTAEWVSKLMYYFRDQKFLHKRYTLQLIEKCRDILAGLPSLVDYTLEDYEELTVCGDIHGQYYDLLNIFKLNGAPAEHNKYLFNGDFVDRGSFSVECIVTLIAWKCAGRYWMHMTRGNHEARQVNMVYGFQGEVEAKYKDKGVYEAFSELFCALPLAYVFNKKVMVCHGGLPSEDGVLLEDIVKTHRFAYPPYTGIMCDLLWADPAISNGRSPSKRGVSTCFGPDITQRFLEANKLELLIRSHYVKAEGYEVTHNGQCVTIFSAPNYCDFSNNLGAYIRLRGKYMKPKYNKFSFVPHPNIGAMAYANKFRGMF